MVQWHFAELVPVPVGPPGFRFEQAGASGVLHIVQGHWPPHNPKVRTKQRRTLTLVAGAHPTKRMLDFENLRVYDAAGARESGHLGSAHKGFMIRVGSGMLWGYGRWASMGSAP